MSAAPSSWNIIGHTFLLMWVVPSLGVGRAFLPISVVPACVNCAYRVALNLPARVSRAFVRFLPVVPVLEFKERSRK